MICAVTVHELNEIFMFGGLFIFIAQSAIWAGWMDEDSKNVNIGETFLSGCVIYHIIFAGVS